MGRRSQLFWHETPTNIWWTNRNLIKNHLGFDPDAPVRSYICICHGVGGPFCQVLTQNKGRNTTLSSFLLKYRGWNYTHFPETRKRGPKWRNVCSNLRMVNTLPGGWKQVKIVALLQHYLFVLRCPVRPVCNLICTTSSTIQNRVQYIIDNEKDTPNWILWVWKHPWT